jgi:hypothetical protein
VSATKEHELPGGRANLVEALQLTGEAIMDANKELTQDAFQVLIYRLNGLLSFSSFLNAAIGEAEKFLKLRDATSGMAEVQRLIPEDTAGQDSDLASAMRDFSRSVEMLRNMQQELESRVHEHGQFQDLDMRLRVICEAPPTLPPATLLKDWRKVKELRSSLTPPLSTDEMRSMESEIEAALNGNDNTARDVLKDYHYEVSNAFFRIDSDLKNFMGQLKTLNPVVDALIGASEDEERT